MSRNSTRRRAVSATVDHSPRRIDRVVWLGLAGIGLGGATLLVYAWVEYVNNPGISIVDGYWIGRVPWTPIGVWLVIGGASLALVGAAASVVVRGGWIRRLLLIPVGALPVLWWSIALGVLPFPRYLPPAPMTLAYSLPESAVLSLVLPALAAALLALLPHRPDLRAHIRPVHADDLHSRTGGGAG
jgi:hypothetical protein